ncbi:hypothetical protein [Granulicella aggregans]|uniref:hypothetical protein n=1 Tax=Granulicella aggregans TaxID=474949 RepID=UPI0021E08FA4|nr:hypothetical protein [Granulicella aggregans]
MKHRLSLPLLLVVVAIGCDKKVANSSNLEKGLNHYLTAQQQCPNTHAADFPTQPIVARTDYDAYAKVGLVSKVPSALDGNGQPRFIYDLTSKGKDTQYKGKILSGNETPRIFCFGTLKVDKILNFTDPAPNQGVSETHVYYTTKLVDTPDWLADPDIQGVFRNFPTIMEVNRRKIRASQGLPDNSKMEAAMGLTAEGWRVPQDM